MTVDDLLFFIKFKKSFPTFLSGLKSQKGIETIKNLMKVTEKYRKFTM